MRCPHCHKEIKFDVPEQHRIERREMILKNITEEISLETLYRRLRRKKYPATRRTFQRDIVVLKDQLYIVTRVKIGGKSGTTTKIYPTMKLALRHFWGD